MSTPRDIQFAGFAKALWDELPDVPNNPLDIKTYDTWSDACEKLIAQRAHDLVRHTCEEIAMQEGYGRVSGRYMLDEIPDMSELSGGVQ